MLEAGRNRPSDRRLKLARYYDPLPLCAPVYRPILVATARGAHSARNHRTNVLESFTVYVFRQFHFGNRRCIGWLAIGHRTYGQSSTTLADLFTLLFAANPFSAARASLRRWSSDEFEDGLAHGGQCRSRRRPVDSFFSALLFLAGGIGGKRRRSSSLAPYRAGPARVR